MASSSIHWGLPDPALFSFPPRNAPDFIPPASAALPGVTAAVPPYVIPDHVYQWWLEPKVPITIAATYAITAKLLNSYNKSTGKRPWAISKTRPFFWFVVAHNIFLAVYSAWTWWGMLGALKRSVVSPVGPAGWAGTADSLCRIFGPAGLGNGAYYSESLGWQSHAPGVGMASGPDSNVGGRIWNEGLAFYGWLFYLSKFYEVFDTLIILAKGKLSSTLQTYHHAGAMMCMWAGIRYMTVPIWTFVFLNSFIHAMMYTYYTLTAFSIKVPVFIKRTLTTMQITQFIVGASYAMVHSFVSYTVPATTKGAAERVVPCITSAGETFAVWLNVLYLAPLTYLFVNFFIQSYLRRSSGGVDAARGKKKIAPARRESNVTAEKADRDAARQVEQEMYSAALKASGNGVATNGKAVRANGKSR